MLDAERLLGNLLGGTLSRTLGGRGASIFRGGALGSKANIGVGLVGLAIAAYEHYQQTASANAPVTSAHPPPPPPPAPTGTTANPPPPPPPASAATATSIRQADALVLIRAMIAAAQADARIDDRERARIAQATSGLSASEKSFLDAELAAPYSIERLAAASRPEIAADVYAAAAHAIVADNDAERAWLSQLGDALHLDAATRDALGRPLADH